MRKGYMMIKVLLVAAIVAGCSSAGGETKIEQMDFQAEGERSGQYILGGEELTLNEKGESIISYADYAIAMVDEIAAGSHIGERISVVRK